MTIPMIPSDAEELGFCPFCWPVKRTLSNHENRVMEDAPFCYDHCPDTEDGQHTADLRAASRYPLRGIYSPGADAIEIEVPCANCDATGWCALTSDGIEWNSDD